MGNWRANDGNADRAIFDRAKQREIDRLRIESENFQSFYEERAWRMAFALVEHFEMLQSTFLAAQRDAIYESDGQANYALLANEIHDVLKKHLETYEEAKELIENVNSRVISKNKETYEGSLGWLYHSPDSGTEWSDQHPVSSGEVPDALEIRPATAQNLRDELIRAWAALDEMCADYNASEEAIEDLQADYEELKFWVDNNDARPIAEPKRASKAAPPSKT
ncbi:hypothetical protein GCM10008171_33280 [Methylopila jiangsuensis]|uniref:Uncharacterized protein n=1 Tax=Methylopila jiangsuensis TaxID=586230 RepID=A0A9W6JL07_9HYPH|nr:hypothetical protein [Methylopila jiangsuensis]MDR6284538.1 crotonobetainyl-CoA:carnitine CoA-transferase CaiB-like acyl-CoA transferase [Methylopila jiangsuensis]GLK78074.1 hypothetical protein GCM10008171_33280 [Methylopila jiangsuensis]